MPGLAVGFMSVTILTFASWIMFEASQPAWLKAIAGFAVIISGVSLTLLVTFQLKAEREKQQHQEIRQRYLDLLKISEDLIWTTDRDGTITQINDAAWPILGMTPENIIGQPFLDFIPPSEQHRVASALAGIRNGKTVRHFVTMMLTIDQETIQVNLNAKPSLDPSGSISGITGTATNVTEQVRSLEVLARSERRYRQMFEQNRAIKLILDSNSGRIVEANDAARDYYGYAEAQLIGMPIDRLFHFADPAQPAVLHALASDECDSHLLKQRLSSDEIRDAEVHAGPISVNGQHLLYLVVHDITERMNSEHALRENEQKLQGIVEAASEGIVMLDEAGRVVLFNPAAQRIFRYTEQEILGKSFDHLLEPGFLQENNGIAHSDIKVWLAAMNDASSDLIGQRDDSTLFPLRLALSRVDIDASKHYVVLLQDISESKRKEERLNYLAQHDVLTGLLNRREFKRRLDLRLTSPESPDELLTLCYIDIDQFGIINNSCGQTAGNELLKQISTLITSQMHEAEIIGRLGGDEFGVLFTDCTIERAQHICNTLLQTMKSFHFNWEEQSFDIALSIGLTGFSPSNENISGVLSAAHIACNMAKARGHNHLHIYHAGDIELIKEYGDMRLISRITQALNEERFRLMIQPIAALQEQATSPHHYEVLVKMRDEKGRTINPDNFIPAAERYVLMPAIDRWVINNLFSTQGDNLRQWSEELNRDTFLFAVNLSGCSLNDEGFLNYLLRQFTEWRIPYQSICFEITETAAVSSLERAQHLINRLREQGCSFALDDFGTGLSSYSYLKDLPVDYLKIDGAFVRNFTIDRVNQAMVESINQVGHALGLKTIAEWAENQTALERLQAMGVDYAQGYGVGKPRPLESFGLTATVHESCQP